jgi:4-hydroxy-tetrahydrodipicolinate synthase
MVEFDIAAGAKSLLLTYGDSQYSILTDQEVADVTRIVAGQAAGRALVVAADRQWGTSTEIEFAQYCLSVGADVLMVLPPDWVQSCSKETFIEHYAAVARHIPVMGVTNVFAPRPPAFTVDVFVTLAERTPNFVAMKDDVRGELVRKLCLALGERIAIFAGGAKFNHLDIMPYGGVGYLSTFITFAPDVTRVYWQAIERRDMKAALEIIEKTDIPFFDYIRSVPGSYDAAIHGTMELFGVAGRWRRKPYYSLNDEEMERLREFYRGLNLLS